MPAGPARSRHDAVADTAGAVVTRRGVSGWLLGWLRWKLLLARWVVGTLAVMATVAAVPGLSIDGHRWLWTATL
jgi:hypothetical protein